MHPPVRLTVCFKWVCPDGHVNYHNGVSMEWSDDAIREQFDIEPWEEISDEMREEVTDTVTLPAIVTCATCKTKCRVDCEECDTDRLPSMGLEDE